jgi:hypothetical protein
MKTLARVSLALVAIVLCSPSAKADWNEGWGCGAEYSAEECAMLSGNEGWDTTGIAPGIVSCLSREGCKKCMYNDELKRNSCSTALMDDGSCLCEPKKGPTGTITGCTTQGMCFYRK